MKDYRSESVETYEKAKLGGYMLAGARTFELHEREVDGEEEMAERRARATDGEEVEVVAVGGGPLGGLGRVRE